MFSYFPTHRDCVIVALLSVDYYKEIAEEINMQQPFQRRLSSMLLTELQSSVAKKF